MAVKPRAPKAAPAKKPKAAPVKAAAKAPAPKKAAPVKTSPKTTVPKAAAAPKAELKIPPKPSTLKPAKIPTRDEIMQAVIEAGSGHSEFFGFPKKDDGLWLQQDPEEFSAFVHFMATVAPPCTLGLDIGIAAGGATKFLRDFYSIPKTIIVDIAQHPDHPQWKRIRPLVKTEFELEVYKDSHSEEVRQALLPYAGKIDFAFVDGDHSYRGLRKDVFLVKELLKVGSYMILHDTLAAGDCAKVFRDLTFSRDFVLVRNFANRFGISIWRLNQVRKMPTAFNRRYGRGEL